MLISLDSMLICVHVICLGLGCCFHCYPFRCYVMEYVILPWCIWYL